MKSFANRIRRTATEKY